MEKSFEQIDKEMRRYVEKVVTELNAADIQLFADLSAPKHYTFVSLLPPEVNAKINRFVDKLIEVEPALLLNKPELYHLTIFHCPAEHSPETLTAIITDHLRIEPLEFDLDGLLATPIGAGVVAYPRSDALIRLRRKLYQATSREFPEDYRGYLSWITVARCKEKPGERFFQILKEFAQVNFGRLTVDKIEAYLSEDKNLETGQKVGEATAKQPLSS